MKKKILIVIVSMLILIPSIIIGYKTYKTNKWIDENWDDSNPYFGGDTDRLKGWLKRREAMGIKSSKNDLSEILFEELSGRGGDSVEKENETNLILSMGADPNFCRKPNDNSNKECLINHFLKYGERLTPDSLEVIELIIKYGGKIDFEYGELLGGYYDCSFPGSFVTNDKLFNFIFKTYLNNKPSSKIIECSTKSLIGNGVHQFFSSKQFIERLSYLSEHDLNPNILIPGFIKLKFNDKEDHVHVKAPLMYHLIYTYWLHGEEFSPYKDDFYKLISTLLKNGADINAKPTIETDTTIMSLAQKTGDTKLFALLNSKSVK